MADLKISQLSDGGNAQAADEFVVARSGNNFRVDGASVAAAATSVGTLSSLTVSGNVTVDTNTLFVDSVNNRVGILTAGPLHALDIVTTSNSTVNARIRNESTGSSAYAMFGLNASGNSWGMRMGSAAANSNALEWALDAYGTPVVKMTLDASGNLTVNAAGPRVGANRAIAVEGASSSVLEANINGSRAGMLYSDAAQTIVGEFRNMPLLFRTNDTVRALITSGGNFIPGANNAYSLGDGSTRWTEVFAVNGTINTSDANAKADVQEDVPGWDFIAALRPVHYKWKTRKRVPYQVEDGTEWVEVTPAVLDEDGHEITPAVTEERPKYRTEYEELPGVRRHLGFIAQEVRDSLGDRDFGLVTHDPESDEWGLRYDQFHAPMVKALQEAMARIETLEARLAALESVE